MSNEIAKRDSDRTTVLLLVTNDSNQNLTQGRVDPITLRLLVDAKLSQNALISVPATGQVKIAVTGTAVQFGTNTLPNGVIVTANSSNAAVVTLGGSGITSTADGTGNGYVLGAGGSVSFAVANSNVLYVNGTAGDWVSFAGS